MASLLVLKGANPGQRFPLDKDKIVIGRDPQCQVVVNGTAVSRTHAHILRQQGKYYIEDLKSRNGTLVNNEVVSGRRLLNDTDRIKICDFLCTFHDSSRPLPADLRADEPEEEPGTSSAIEAAIPHQSSHTLLDSQPAEKLKAILEISSNLSKTLEVDTLLPKIIDSLFHLYKQADRGFLIMRDPGTQKLVPKVIKSRRDPEDPDERFSNRIINQCLETVQALLSDDAATDTRFGMSESIVEFRIRSVMCAPLWSQNGKAFGAIQLDTQDRSKKFTEEDLNLLVGVASQASIALENAKMHQDLLLRERVKRDLELAREVQRSFLPLRPPSVAGYEFFAHYESAQEVGGDYYDFIPLPQHRLAVMLGDVAGKGVAAALLMAKISADARFCMLTESEPAAAITKLNDLLHQAGLTDRFVTLAAAVLNPKTHEITLVNAGHPSPLIHRRATGTLEEATPKEMAGVPIGVLEGFPYTSCTAQLQPGDNLLIFSDGVTEAMDIEGNQLQLDGIIAALKSGASSTRGLGEQIVKAVQRHAAGRSQHDDITLVCFGRNGA